MSHRKKNKRQAKQRRRERRRIERKRSLAERGERAVLHRTRQMLPGEQFVVAKPADGVKMSELLEDFVAPYCNGDDSKVYYEQLLGLGTIVWNAALMPPEDRENAMRELLATFPPEHRAEGWALVKDMQARREREFANYRRFIINYALVADGPRRHLTVASTPVPL